MTIELESAGLSRMAAEIRASEFIKTGQTLPVATKLNVGDKLVKVVPAGGRPSPQTAYWLRESEWKTLKKDPASIIDRLGLPPGMQVDKFDIYQIQPRVNETLTFQSKIAATTVDGVPNLNGGAIQTLVLDRNKFTLPIKTGSISIPKKAR